MKKFIRSVVFGAMVVMAPIVMVTPSLATYLVDGVVNTSEGYPNTMLGLKLIREIP